MNTAPIISKVWSFSTTLRDDGARTLAVSFRCGLASESILPRMAVLY